jgi:hypothetical protein
MVAIALFDAQILLLLIPGCGCVGKSKLDDSESDERSGSLQKYPASRCEYPEARRSYLGSQYRSSHLETPSGHR